MDGVAKSEDKLFEWYALELEGCTETVHTANEKDLTYFQEGMGRFPVPCALCLRNKTDSEGASEGFASSIGVAGAVTKKMVGLGKREEQDRFIDEVSLQPKKKRNTKPNKEETKVSKQTSLTDFFARGR